MITIYDAFAVIGMISTAVFIYLLYVATKMHNSEAKPMDINQVKEELPKWEKMNVVARMANRELNKIYKNGNRS